MKPYLLKALIRTGLFLAISLLPPMLAQGQNVPARINLLVMEGEGVTSGMRQRVTPDLVVKVEDDDHRPVAGAVVVFALPVSGASGEFGNGTRNLTVVTDQDGLAAAHGLRTNDVPGKLQIYITASYRGLRARSLINQFVQAAPGSKMPLTEARSSKSGGKWKWVVLGVAAAGGAGAGLYYGIHSASGSTSPVSISVGTVAFGSPR
jgi:hypothetical protein